MTTNVTTRAASPRMYQTRYVRVMKTLFSFLNPAILPAWVKVNEGMAPKPPADAKPGRVVFPSTRQVDLKFLVDWLAEHGWAVTSAEAYRFQDRQRKDNYRWDVVWERGGTSCVTPEQLAELVDRLRAGN